MDDVTLTLRAQDQASGALRAINAQLARMRQLTDATNRATAAATGRTARSADAEEARRYVRNQQRIIAEVRRRVDRENRERERGRRQAEREAERTARTQEREAARAARAQERAAERVARAIARAEALHRRQWSAQAFLSGMRGTQGASRIIAQMFGGGQTGMAGYGAMFGTGLNTLIGSLTLMVSITNNMLSSAIRRVFGFLLRTVTQLIRSFIRLAAVVGTTLVAAITAVGYSALNAASQIQQMSIGLDTLVGKGEKAKRFMQEMMEFARKTPFDFFQMMPDTRRLLGVGFSTEEVKSLMQSMGDAAAALGIGQAGITGLVKAFSDVRAKGYVQAQEITRQFAEWGVPALRFISEYLGTTEAVTLQLIQQRKVTAQIGIAAIQAGMARNFGGAMERQFRTISGQLNTLKETWGFTMAAIGEASLKPIEGIIAGITGMLNAFRTGGGAEKVGKWLAGWLTPQRVSNFVQVALRAINLLGIAVSWLYTKLAAFFNNLVSGDIWVNIANSMGRVADYIVNMFDWALSKIPALAEVYLSTLFNMLPTIALAAVDVIKGILGTLANEFKWWFLGIGALLAAIGSVLVAMVAGAQVLGLEIAAAGGAAMALGGSAAAGAFDPAVDARNAAAHMAELGPIVRTGATNAYNALAAGPRPDFNMNGLPQTRIGQAVGLQGYRASRANIGGAVSPWLQGAGNQFETEMMKYLNTPLADINNNTAAALGLLGSIDDSLSPRGFGANKQTELLRNRLARTNLGGGGVRIHITGGNLRDQEVAEQAITQYVNQTNPFAASPSGVYVGAH